MTVAEHASLEAVEAAFRRHHPRYAATGMLDKLRRTEFARLDAGGHVYLDYTGGGLYADSQLREHMRLLQNARVWQPALDQSRLGREHRGGRARPRARAGLLQRLT